MRRVAVVGCSGTGKTRLARRLADLLGVDHVELDSLHHGPGWVASPAAEMRQQIELRYPAGGRWVADGNYTAKGGEADHRWVRLTSRTEIRRFLEHIELVEDHRGAHQPIALWATRRSSPASGPQESR